MNNVAIKAEQQKIKIYMILMLLFGMMMSVLVPMWQTPDEFVHLQTIESTLGNPWGAFFLIYDEEMDNARIRGNADEVISQEVMSVAVKKEPAYTWDMVKPVALGSGIVRYLPSALGIVLGLRLGLPTFWVLTLGEILALIFYCIMCYLAISITPVAKELFMLFMICPVAMQQGSGIGYDVMLLSFSYVFLAYILRLTFGQGKIRGRDLCVALVLAGVITFIKVPYVFMLLLLFIIPLDCIEVHIGKYVIDEKWLKRYWKIGCGLAVVALALLVYILRNNYWVHLLLCLGAEFPRTVWLLGSSVAEHGTELIQTAIGSFGWFDAKLPKVMIVLIYIFLLYMAYRQQVVEEEYINRKQKMIIWGVFLVQTIFIFFSMVNHTIRVEKFGSENVLDVIDIRKELYQIKAIGGVQGRYFLPFLLLPFLAWPNWMQKKITTKVKKENSMNLVIGFEIGMMLSTGVTLLLRYWI